MSCKFYFLTRNRYSWGTKSRLTTSSLGCERREGWRWHRALGDGDLRGGERYSSRSHKPPQGSGPAGIAQATRRACRDADGISRFSFRVAKWLAGALGRLVRPVDAGAGRRGRQSSPWCWRSRAMQSWAEPSRAGPGSVRGAAQLSSVEERGKLGLTLTRAAGGSGGGSWVVSSARDWSYVGLSFKVWEQCLGELGNLRSSAGVDYR